MKRAPYVTKRERKAKDRAARKAAWDNLTAEQQAQLKIRAIASQIHSERDLQRILLTVEPAMRVAVEKLIRPLTQIAHG